MIFTHNFSSAISDVIWKDLRSLREENQSNNIEIIKTGKEINPRKFSSPKTNGFWGTGSKPMEVGIIAAFFPVFCFFTIFFRSSPARIILYLFIMRRSK